MKWSDLIPFRSRSTHVPVIREDYHPLSRFEREFHRLMDEFFHDLHHGFLWSPWDRETFAPEMDLKETNDAFEVVLDVPGVKPEDIEVRLEKNTLVVRGKKSEEYQDKEGAWHIRECRYGAFERVIPLPSEIKEDGVEASFDRGTLKIHLPKATPSSPLKKIPVKVK